MNIPAFSFSSAVACIPWSLALPYLIGCSTAGVAPTASAEPPDSAPEVSMNVPHPLVQAAVAETHDAELASWVTSPDAYLLLPSKLAPALGQHSLYFLTPADTAAPRTRAKAGASSCRCAKPSSHREARRSRPGR